jgi:hypothetical protein
MEDHLRQLRIDADKIIEKISGASSDLFAMGAEAERFIIFEKFRRLIAEKDLVNDQQAADVLGWAYEKISQ